MAPGRFGRHLSYNLIQTGVEVGALTLVSLVVARIYGPHLFGILALVLSGAQWISMVVDGFIIAQMRAVAEEATRQIEAAARVGWRCVGGALGLSLALSLLLVLGVFLWRLELLTDWWPEIAAAVFVAVSRLGKYAIEAAFRGLRNFAIPALWACLLAPLQAAALIVLAMKGYGPFWYLMVMGGFQTLNMGLLALSYARQYFRAPAEPAQATLASVFAYAVPLLPRGALGYFHFKVNTVILAAFFGEAAAGHFGLAERVLLVPLLLYGVIVNAVSPRVAALKATGDEEGLRAMTHRTYGLVLAVSFPLAAAFLLNGLVIRPLFPQYTDATEMVQWLGWCLPLLGLSYVATGAILVQGGHPKAALWVSLATGVVNVAAVWLGARFGGPVLAVAGGSLAQIAASIAGIIVTHRLLNLPFRLRLF